MKRLTCFFRAVGDRLIRNARCNGRSIAVIIAVAFVFLVFKVNSYTEDVNKGLSDSLIRLHVVANSDSPEDQELKRVVRDRILEYIREETENSASIEQTKTVVSEKIPEITRIAKETVRDKGYDYDVETALGMYPFPTKAYGDIVLPAGNYQALKVVIGDGRGSNWWCVLFPPLCFVDVTHGTVPDMVKDDLREVLTDEEYSIIASAEDGNDIPIRIKFKIVELFQDSKIKLAGAFSKLFSLEG
ncbi:MAG: stage II sporulation protein R [Clostridiaceae bacterium]|jgi:stage II sporulation protein R|nr:stage II sporulation protein R [Clostridiaceae bacterium]